MNCLPSLAFGLLAQLSLAVMGVTTQKGCRSSRNIQMDSHGRQARLEEGR